ncbi:uncharacterized protein LOC124352874 [Homalodisca vitripennis]|nr:uncharacterized protein LOC124352874 [Homalodisca vitripennis]
MSTFKDYSRPLHVDCSVEYELPNAAKPPANARTEPLLMIHPCYYRRAESQRRSPFINNLPATRQRVPQTQYPVRYPKRDPMLCGTAEFSGDSGVSGVGHWTDTGSPLAQETRLHAGPDSGIVADKSGLTALSGTCWEATPDPASTRLYGSSRGQNNADSNRELRDSTNQVSRHSWALTSDFLGVNGGGEVNNNNNQNQHVKDTRLHQPAVGVAAVASCKACQPQFLHPQQRTQQPWPGVTASAVTCSGTTRHRVRAVEPGPEHAASSLHRRPPPAWPSQSAWPAPPAKRSRLLPPSDCCKVCTQWTYPQCRTTQDNSRVLWNNESMLRLYQV